MQAGTPTGSVGSNNPNNFETGEPSNPFQNIHKNKHTDNFKNKRKFLMRNILLMRNLNLKIHYN